MSLESDDDFVAAVAQVLGLRVPLTAIAKNRDRLRLQCRRISVGLVENGCHRTASLSIPLKYRPVGRLKIYATGAGAGMSSLNPPLANPW